MLLGVSPGGNMSLQKKILQQYRVLYPHQSLRDISKKTGIQLTRVFRLFNGAPMKLNEYEVFYEFVHIQFAHEPFQKQALASLHTLFQMASPQTMLEVNKRLQRDVMWCQLLYGEIPAHKESPKINQSKIA